VENVRCEELNDLYRAPRIVRIVKSMRLRWTGYVARIRKTKNPCKILVRKPFGKRPFERPRKR
jgi:hypothetical protein